MPDLTIEDCLRATLKAYGLPEESMEDCIEEITELFDDTPVVEEEEYDKGING